MLKSLLPMDAVSGGEGLSKGERGVGLHSVAAACPAMGPSLLLHEFQEI